VGRDILSFYTEMRRTEMIFTGVIVVAILIGTAMFLWMLARLIFRGVESIIALARGSWTVNTRPRWLSAPTMRLDRSRASSSSSGGCLGACCSMCLS
jgi:hypothetical protein